MHPEEEQQETKRQFPSAWYQRMLGKTLAQAAVTPFSTQQSWDREVGAEHLARMPQTLTSTPKARRMKSRDRNRETPNPKPKCPPEDDYLKVN